MLIASDIYITEVEVIQKREKTLINQATNFKAFWQFLESAQPILMGDELNDLVYINSDGTLIYNMDTGHFLKPYLRADGRHEIKLKLATGEWKAFLVHRLVADAYIPNPENKPIVHHINGNPKDNRASNLLWVTAQEHKEIHDFVCSYLAGIVKKYGLTTRDIFKMIRRRKEQKE